MVILHFFSFSFSFYICSIITRVSRHLVTSSTLMAYQGVPSLSSAAGASLGTNQTILGASHNHVEKEQQCVLHWFQGWSGYQREDFFKFLLDRAVPQNVDTLFDAMNSLKVRDGPPSIFQCQLKLLGEWFADWTDKERNDLMTWLAARDPAFVERFNHEVMKAGQVKQSWMAATSFFQLLVFRLSLSPSYCHRNVIFVAVNVTSIRSLFFFFLFFPQGGKIYL